jgi:hypothetical protein
VFTVYEYGLLVIIRVEPENRLLRSGNRIFGYQIPEQYFGSTFLKPEFLITRKNRPELSGKTECPALPYIPINSRMCDHRGDGNNDVQPSRRTDQSFNTTVAGAVNTGVPQHKHMGAWG